MSDAQTNNSFMKAFVPGLVVGVIVGGLATAVLLPFIAERTSTVDAAEIPISNQAPDRFRGAPPEETQTPDPEATPEVVDPANVDPAAVDPAAGDPAPGDPGANSPTPPATPEPGQPDGRK